MCHNFIIGGNQVDSLYLSFWPYRWSKITLYHDKMLDWSKLKAFVDDKLNSAAMIVIECITIENVVGKRENAAYQHFILFS